MPRYIPDGSTKVTWVPGVNGVADPEAPTVVELEVGVDLECFLAKAGLNITFNENAVEDGVLCEKFDAQLAGTFGLSAELTMMRHNAEGGDVDTAWTTFHHGDNGWLVVRNGIDLEDSPDWEAGDPAEVYRVQAGNKRPAPTASNTNHRFMVSFYGRATPDQDSVVVAS